MRTSPSIVPSRSSSGFGAIRSRFALRSVAGSRVRTGHHLPTGWSGWIRSSPGSSEAASSTTAATRSGRAARRLGLGLGDEVPSDVDLGLSATFGLVLRVPGEMVRIVASVGRDIPARHGTGGWLLPIPATDVVDADGTAVAATVDPDFTRRMDPEDVLAALERMREVRTGTTR